MGYPKSHIDIEVVLQRGSNRNAEEVDIVVYDSPIHRQENAYIIIEIETPRKHYDLQAFSYVTATTAPYCVWFAMDVIEPSYKNNEIILDTACGSGGFLPIAVEKLRNQIAEL